MLIQNPGVQKRTHNNSDPPTNYGSSWDLILPAGWSMAFWVSLIYQGARAGGLRELENLSTEQSSLHFPSDYPDSEAGKKVEQVKFKDLSDSYNRKPPAKRPNFIKLGIMLPFQFPWQQLIEEWNKGDNQEVSSRIFYVLRNKSDLSTLSRPFFDVKTMKHKNKDTYKSCVCDTDLMNKLTHNKSVTDVAGRHGNSLVAVQVKMVTRGAPDEYANICIPSKNDFLSLVGDNNHGGPMEEIHADSTKVKKKDKKNKKSVSGNTEEINQRDVIPIACDNLIRSCGRPIIGYLKQGGMSLSVGQGRGIGYCAMGGIKELLRVTPNNMPSIVLIRNPNSYQYRFAYIQLLL